jgi:hypothetical protein
MIENLDNYLIGIALGIRFRANFSIEDQLGNIVDTILYSKDSFFNPAVFPKAVPIALGAKQLVNEATQDNLTINNSNFLLEINFGDDLKFSSKQLDEIIEKFDTQIVKGILKQFSIKKIIRVGYVRRYLFQIETLAASFIGKTIGDSFGGINDINLSFSKKIPVSESLVKKDVLDFDNAIFNVIKKANLDEIFMSIDYQSFYDPFLPSSSMIGFKSFIDTATNFNNKQYLPWLNRNYLEKIEHE